MKIALLAGSLFLSQIAFAEAYWSCQCFENIVASDSIGGVEIPTTLANTLKDAQKEALKVCKGFVESTTVVSCLKFVKADH